MCGPFLFRFDNFIYFYIPCPCNNSPTIRTIEITKSLLFGVLYNYLTFLILPYVTNLFLTTKV